MEEHKEIKSAARQQRLQSLAKDKAKFKKKQRQQQHRHPHAHRQHQQQQQQQQAKYQQPQHEEEEEEGQEEEGEVVTTTQPRRYKYSRRIIQSNASRYEEPEDELEEEDTKDFRVLLQAAQLQESDALSFQFSNEKEWEEGGQQTPRLDLDLAQLEKNLSQLPLGTRLRIESHFLVSGVCLFIEV